MPELPEVETITNDLRMLVVGRRIESADVRDPRIVRYPDVPSFLQRVTGADILSITRKAKYILVWLSSKYILFVQLMVTGQLLLVQPTAPMTKTTRLILILDDASHLRLVDSSYLARVGAVTEEELRTRLHLDELGPEAIAPELTLEKFAERLRGRRGAIKPVLLDQHVVSGPGSIYADEALFAARVSPVRPVESLTDEELSRLYTSLRRILTDAIKHRGTTTRSYRDVLGRKGHYQDLLHVHARAGQPCPDCGGLVRYIMVGGRPTYYCPSCQR